MKPRSEGEPDSFPPDYENTTSVETAESDVSSAEEDSARQEEERAAGELASFLPDYESAPLLSTTDIKSLSLQVGADEQELRFNWLSPSPNAGMVEWKDEEGNVNTIKAGCSQSLTLPGYFVNKASVTDLVPGASYSYRVGNDDAWSPEYAYQAPEPYEGELTFLVTSDVQIGRAEMEEPKHTSDRWDSVLTRLENYIPEASFLFHLGDQVADFGAQEHYDLFLDHLGLYRIPLAPLTGNHDVANEYSIEESGQPGGPYFYEHFNVPNRSLVGQTQYDTDGCYYFIRGDALFIVLNSLTHFPSEMMEEYVAEVVREHSDVKWRILAQHYGPYSSVAKYQETYSAHVRDYLARMAIDNDIDLVLSGHDHIYSRTAFLDRDCQALEGYDYQPGGMAIDPDGALYVTCGTSSGCHYKEMTGDPHIVYQQEPGSPIALRIDLTQNELHLRAYEVDSWTMCDEYTIQKSPAEEP